MPIKVSPDYPRPQFVRAEWLDLCGKWEFEFDDTRHGLISGWNNQRLTDEIIVPFPYQSDLSGIKDKGVHEVVWYSKVFDVPSNWHGKDILLNFGAVDYNCEVWINGHNIGHNSGGHVPFSFDIAPYLRHAKNRITVRVEDCQNPYQPRGKQSTTGLPRHIDYYCTTGIWQPVWLEPAPTMRIDSFTITSSIPECTFNLRIYLHAPASLWTLDAEVYDGDTMVTSISQDTHRAYIEISIPIPDAKLWSPESPHLYDIVIRLKKDQTVMDEIQTYVGMRSIELRNGSMWLNGKPLYLAMVLDQGYWPGSYLAAPSSAALKEDVEWVRRLGFNGIRKHQKIEDPRWLTWCDKLGVVVWAEMPNARAWSSDAEEHLMAEWERVLRRDVNHPCIVTWVPVNESMGFPGLEKSHPGQYSFLERMCALTRRVDPERPVIDNDGWEHTDITDICAIHDYTPTADKLANRYTETLRNGTLPPNAWDSDKSMFVRGSRYRGQPIMLTEVGGFLMERTDLPKEEWDLLYAAYGTTYSSSDLMEKYMNLIEGIAKLPFVSGFCYTQLTDIEQEMNGLLTFDRRPKVDPDVIAKVNRRIIENYQPSAVR